MPPEGYERDAGNMTRRSLSAEGSTIKNSRVASAVADLESRLAALQDKILQLHQNLTPVLRPVPPAANSEPKVNAQPPSCGWVAQRVETASQRALAMISEIDEIAERLEI